MNKTISINISGFVFNIEEQAYMALRKYLETIRTYFENSEGVDEIMNDIELRIAELFQERLGENREVVTMADVDYAETVMGKPSDIAEGAEDQEESNSGSYQSTNSHRKIYRDPDNNMIGGVAAGISNYFGWDPLWIRILFVVLAISGGFGIPIYILLWIIVPEARTTAEKLRMHGEKINVENIKKKVNEEMDSLKDQFKDISDKTKKNVSSNSFKQFVESVFQFLGSVLRGIAKILVKLVGVLLFIIGIGLLIGGIAIFLVNDSFLNLTVSELNWTQLGEFFYLSEVNLWLFIISTIMLFLAPTVACFYGGYKLLINEKSQIPGLGITLFSLFILGIVTASVAGIRYGREMANKGVIKTTQSPVSATDTLYIDVLDDPYFHNSLRHSRSNVLTALQKDGNDVVNGHGVRLELQATSDNEFQIEVKRKSRALKEIRAVEFAESIDFNYDFSDSLLAISPFIKIPYKDGFRYQEVSVTVFIPEGKTIYLDEDIGRIYYNASRGGDFWVLENESLTRSD